MCPGCYGSPDVALSTRLASMQRCAQTRLHCSFTHRKHGLPSIDVAPRQCREDIADSGSHRGCRISSHFAAAAGGHAMPRMCRSHRPSGNTWAPARHWSLPFAMTLAALFRRARRSPTAVGWPPARQATRQTCWHHSTRCWAHPLGQAVLNANLQTEQRDLSQLDPGPEDRLRHRFDPARHSRQSSAACIPRQYGLRLHSAGLPRAPARQGRSPTR